MALEEKEGVIQEQTKALQSYRAAFVVLKVVLRPLYNVAHRLRALFRPRLGNLFQHPPRGLRLPAAYFQPIKLSATPRISVVTPGFAQGNSIERTIKSVLDQAYSDLEYFVQDGGSSDATVEILERYSDRLAGRESRPDSGQAHAINLGFAKTTGEIMAWLNSYDLLLPGALHITCNALKCLIQLIRL